VPVRRGLAKLLGGGAVIVALLAAAPPAALASTTRQLDLTGPSACARFNGFAEWQGSGLLKLPYVMVSGTLSNMCHTGSALVKFTFEIGSGATLNPHDSGQTEPDVGPGQTKTVFAHDSLSDVGLSPTGIQVMVCTGTGGAPPCGPAWNPNDPGPSPPAPASTAAGSGPSAPAPSAAGSGPSAPMTAQLLSFLKAPASGSCKTNDAFGCSYWCNRSDLDVISQENCNESGAPGQPYATQNYYLDVGAPSGWNALNPLSWMQTIFGALCAGWWAILVWLFRGALFVVDAAFSVNLLAGKALVSIVAELHTLNTSVFGAPWIGASLVCAGVAAMYVGFVHGRVSQSLGGLAATAVLMIGGLWIVLNPAGTVGYLYKVSGQVAGGTLSAITIGKDQPGAGLGHLEQSMWQTFVYQGWCSADLSEHVCQEKIPAQLCNGASTSIPGDCTLGDLWLRWPTGARGMLNAVAAGQTPSQGQDLCTNTPGLNWLGRLTNMLPLPGKCHYPSTTSQDEAAIAEALKPYLTPAASAVQLQSPGAVFTRVPILFALSIELLLVLTLLVRIALNLLRAAVGVVILLLLTPVALLAAGLGEAGRVVALDVPKRLGGQAVMQAVYAVVLGVLTETFQFIQQNYGQGHTFYEEMLLAAAASVAIGEVGKLMRRMNPNESGIGDALRPMQVFYAARLAGMAARVAGNVTGVRPGARALRARHLAAGEAREDARLQQEQMVDRMAAADTVQDERDDQLGRAGGTVATAEASRDQLQQNHEQLASRRGSVKKEQTNLRGHQTHRDAAKRRKDQLNDQIKQKERDIALAEEEFGVHDAAFNRAAPGPALAAAADRANLAQAKINKLNEDKTALEAQRTAANTEFATADGAANASQSAIDADNAEIARLEAHNAVLDRELRRPETHQAERVVNDAAVNGNRPTAREVDDRVRLNRDGELRTDDGRRAIIRRDARARRIRDRHARARRRLSR
jgi:hypothetical protein